MKAWNLPEGRGHPETGAGTPDLGGITVRDLTLLDSSNLEPAHWSAWARLIGDNYGDYDAFVLTHAPIPWPIPPAPVPDADQSGEACGAHRGPGPPQSYQQRCPEQPGTGFFRGGQRSARGVRGLGNKVIKGDCAKKIFTRNPMPLKVSMKLPYCISARRGSKRTCPAGKTWVASGWKRNWNPG